MLLAIPFIGRISTGAVAVLLLTMAVALVACAQPERTSPELTPALMPPAGAEAAPTAATSAQQSPLTSPGPATTTPDDTSPAAEPTAPLQTATATWPAASDQVPCGVLLPILPVQRPATNISFDRLAADLAVPESAQPALDRLLRAPETVGLVAYEIGRESEGVFLNADAPMPLASVVKIINLIAYAEAAAAGDLNPAEWIPLEEISRTYLPRSDLGAHDRAIQDLEERRLIALDPPATPLEEIPWMMIRHSSNAAADYLHLRLGQRTIEQTVVDLGLDSHTAPCPWVGQFLAMSNSQTPTDNRRGVQSYIEDPERYGREVMRLAESYTYDDAFRASESEPAWRASFNTQLLFSDQLNAQASALDYAGLMSRIVQNQLSSDYTNIVVRRALEWPMSFPINQELFTTIGLKDGSLPGVLTTAYYAQRIEDGASLVVILFFRQLPRQTYRQWLRDLPNDELARWLLSEPSAIPQLRDALQVAD